jgi:GH24 family phage-related lysozyme (muramidase)
MTEPIGSGQYNQRKDSTQVVQTDRILVKNLKPSKEIMQFIIGFEELRLDYYEDNFGYCTVGWGHLTGGKRSCASQGITKGKLISRAEAEKLFEKDLIEAAHKKVQPYIHVPLLQREFDALVDLAFNIGHLGKKAPNLCKTINNGQYSAAANEFLDITNGGVPGLVVRRQRDVQVYLKGIYDSRH